MKRTILTSVVLALALAGCGGTASQTSNLGTATMSITWPERTRVIPVAANSINLSMWIGNNVVASHTVARPTSSNQTTISFTSLPAGTFTLKAQAFPNSDGTGVAQASASQSVAITAGITTPITLTMASTITSITLTPTSPTATVGNTVALTATALDANTSTVLTSSSTLTWGSSNTSVATVNSSGVVTGVSAGTSTITVTDSESGVIGTIVVTIS